MGTSAAMSTTNDRIKYQITITQNNQSVANNTSNVTVSVRFYRTNTGYTTYGTGTVYCTINGTQYTQSVTSADKITSSGIVLFTKTLNITHNADGSKTLATSARISHQQFSSSSQSYSQTLTTIPRATTPTLSASSVNMGASITVTMNRASSAFTHTLTYKFGSATGTIGSDLATSKSWTVPLSLANQIPSATSGTCTITCKTYNGSTLIGTKTVSFTAKVPSSVVPTVSGISTEETVSGIASKFGGYVQGKSKVKVTINASGSYSSTIKSYKTTIDGKAYTGITFTAGVINKSGSVTITTVVTDSRGRTGTKSVNISLIAYTQPAITKFFAYRSDDSGAQVYEGCCVTVQIAFSISQVGGKNSNSFKVEYRQKNTSEWTQLLSETGYTIDTQRIFSEILTTEASYDMRLTVTDYFGSSYSFAELPTAFTLLDFKSSGHALAFGKVSEIDDCVEFGLPFTGGNIDGTITAADNITFSRYTLTKQGDMVTFYANAKCTVDKAAGTTVAVGTLPEGFFPTGSVATTGVQGSTGTCVAWVRNTGEIIFRPAAAYNANQVIEFNLHWNVKSIWH